MELSISDGTESAVFFVFYAEISWLTNVRAAEISELRSVVIHKKIIDRVGTTILMTAW